MTNNKLPEIGKRYRPINDTTEYQMKITSLDDEFVYYDWSGRLTNGEFKKGKGETFLGNFFDKFDKFEELPQEPTDKVREALKSVKYHLGVSQYFDHKTALEDMKDLILNTIGCTLVVYVVLCIFGIMFAGMESIYSLRDKKPCSYPNIASKAIITYPLICEFLEYRDEPNPNNKESDE